ncbi:MAG: hypothetical protein ACI9US_001277, partial [Gammaproteobacteria bacterium]
FKRYSNWVAIYEITILNNKIERFCPRRKNGENWSAHVSVC